MCQGSYELGLADASHARDDARGATRLPRSRRCCQEQVLNSPLLSADHQSWHGADAHRPRTVATAAENSGPTVILRLACQPDTRSATAALVLLVPCPLPKLQPPVMTTR